MMKVGAVCLLVIALATGLKSFILYHTHTHTHTEYLNTSGTEIYLLYLCQMSSGPTGPIF